MDLPTCPACGQSVIDDDVDDCPFCGASLSGKPTKAPASKPADKPVVNASAAKSPTEKPVEKTNPSPPPAAKSQKTEPAAGAEEDPFAVKTDTPKKVVRLNAKPSKGRSHKVVCPMCDTTGYTARKAAGLEVRCVNPDCPLPVFTAPELEKKEEPSEESDSSGLSPPVVVGSAVGGAVVIGVVVWFAFLRGESSQQQPAPAGQPLAGAPSGFGFPSGDAADGGEAGEDPEKTKQPETAEPAFHPAEVRDQLLTTMIDLSEGLRGARKPMSIRLTADALAIAGDEEEVQNQFDRLDSVARSLPYYKIPALTTLAWDRLDSAGAEAAGPLLDQALASAGRLGQFGRDPIDMATMLSAPLVAAGREEQARALIQRHRDSGLLGRLSAAVIRTRYSDGYDIEATVTSLRFHPAADPQSSGVTAILANRGLLQKSLAWAESHPEEDARTEAVALWAETAVGKGATPNDIAASAVKRSPAGKALLWARVANRQLTADDKTAADASMELARAALSSLDAPVEMILPPEEEHYRVGLPERSNIPLPDTAAMRIAVLACGEAARVEAKLERTDEAWEAVRKGLAFARAMAPSISAIQARLDRADDEAAQVQNHIRRSLDLRSTDRARLVLAQYVKQCEEVREVSRQRHALQTSLLAAAATWNLDEQVWAEVQTRSRHEDINLRESYFDTAVPVVLANRFQELKKSDRVKEVQQIFSGGLRPNPAENVWQTAGRAVERGGDLKQVAASLENEQLDRAESQLRRLQLASRLVKAGRMEDAVTFARAVSDPIQREQTLGQIAAQGTAAGHGKTVWQRFQNTQYPAMDRIALGRGFVAGSALLEPARKSIPAGEEAAEAEDAD